MSEYRPQLGVTLPDSNTAIVDENGKPSLEFWRVIERLAVMNANDEPFMQEVRQEIADSEIDDIKTQLALLTAAVNDANDIATAASQDAENARTEALTASEQSTILAPRGNLAGLDTVAAVDIDDGAVVDRTVAVNRGLVVSGPATPDGTALRIFFNTTTNVTWSDAGTGTDGLRRLSNETQDVFTGELFQPEETSGAFIALAEAKFDRVQSSDFVQVIAVNGDVTADFASPPASNDTEITGQWKIILRKTAVTILNDAETGTEGTDWKELWIGGATGLTFGGGSPIPTTVTSDLADALYFQVGGVGEFVDNASGEEFSDAVTIYVYLCLDVSDTSTGNTINLGADVGITVLLST